MPTKTYTTKDTVPPHTDVATITVTTSGAKYTTSAANTFQVGDYIWSVAGNELRKIVDVRSTTEGFMESAFSSDLSAVAVDIITKNDAKVASISVAAPDGGSVTIWSKNGDSSTLPTSTSINRTAAGKDGGEFCEPIIVDGATNNPLVEYTQKGVDY